MRQSTKIRKRSFLLIEVLTASFIAGIIIAACITVLLLFTSSRNSGEALLLASQKRWQEASYLRWILMNIEDEKNTPFLAEGGPDGSMRLLFRVNHGIDSSPNDASDMIAMLYVDREKGLMLVHKPPKKRKDVGFEEEKAYPLWPSAKAVRWSFLAKNDLQEAPEWKDSWSREEKSAPLAIKATITEDSSSALPNETEVTAIVLSQIKDATIHLR